MSLENTMRNTGSVKNADKLPEIDKSEIDKIKKDFVESHDEFDAAGLVWYTPKDAPKHVDRNGIYLYLERMRLL